MVCACACVYVYVCVLSDETTHTPFLSCSHIINYRGDGVPFVNYLKTHPVIDDRSGEVKASIGVLHQVRSRVKLSMKK